MTDIKSELNKFVPLMASKMNVGDNSLCFCGSGKKYRECCNNKSGEDLFFSEEIFEKALRYKNSQGGRIEGIPKLLWNQYRDSSQKKLPCLYPSCSEKTVSCHSTPENILRSCFGGHCLEYLPQDCLAESHFERIGVNKAGTLPVFCSNHDSSLFKKIDPMEIDCSDKEQLFMLAFKAIVFSLRNSQYLLGVDNQIQYFNIIKAVSQNINNANGEQVVIELDFLQKKYRGFVVLSYFFEKLISVLSIRDWDFFSHFYRSIDYSGNIFFTGFCNPSHDLENVRVNKKGIPIGMTCNVFTKDSRLHVYLACPDGESKEAYLPFFEQMENISDSTFVDVINNILTFSAEKPLLSESFIIKSSDLQKMMSSREYAGMCANPSSPYIFDLKDATRAVNFISLKIKSTNNPCK